MTANSRVTAGIRIVIVVTATVLSAMIIETAGTPDGAAPRTQATPAPSPGDRRMPAVPVGDRRVLLFMIDGLSAAAFERAFDAGRMPNLRQIMQERPTSAGVAVSTFPSATSPSVQEMLSGRYSDLDYLTSPGAVHAYDRAERRVVRYVTQPDAWRWPLPTLFDAIAGRPAVTVFEGRWDGPTAILTQYNMASQALLAVLGASALANGDAGPVEAYLDVLRNGTVPVVSLVVVNEFDMAAHFHGPDSAEADSALADCDALLGRILSTLETPAPGRGSLLDATTLIVLGDHGMVRSGTFIDLVRVLAGLGLKAMDVSTIPHVLFRERLGSLWTDWPDAILVAGGSNVTQVYLRQDDGGWDATSGPTAQDRRHKPAAGDRQRLIGAVVGLPGVAQVMWRDDGGAIRVTAAEGDARILERHDGARKRYAYVVAQDAQSDPLGYLGDPAGAGLVCREDDVGDSCYRDSTAWTDATVDTMYPGAVPLVPKVFRPARFAGDLVVTARPGFSFLRNQNGDHGNLHRDAMLTPLVLNGPGVGPCHETHVPRLVDVYPTASVLLGADPDDPAFDGLDGRVLDCTRELRPPLGVE